MTTVIDKPSAKVNRSAGQNRRNIFEVDYFDDTLQLCDDVIGVIFSYFDGGVLLSMGWVSKRFRVISKRPYLWTDKVKVPEYFQIFPYSDLRYVWCKQNIPYLRYEKSRLRRIGSENVVKVCEYANNRLLFELGWVSKSFRSISTSDELWKSRRIRRDDILIRDEELLTKEERKLRISALKLLDDVSPSSPREEYFLQRSLKRRIEEKHVDELYLRYKIIIPLVNLHTHFNDCILPNVSGCPVILVFLVTLALSIILVLHYASYVESNLIVAGLISSACLVPVGCCCYFCGIVSGLRSCANSAASGSAKYVKNLELEGTDFQKEIQFERLFKAGIKGSNSIYNEIENNYDREGDVLTSGIILFMLLGTIINFLIFCIFLYLQFGKLIAGIALWMVTSSILLFSVALCFPICCCALNCFGKVKMWKDVVFDGITHCGTRIYLLIVVLFFMYLASVGGFWVNILPIDSELNDFITMLLICFLLGCMTLCLPVFLTVRLCQCLFFSAAKAYFKQEGGENRGSERLKIGGFPSWDIFVCLVNYLTCFSLLAFMLQYFVFGTGEVFLFIPLIFFSLCMICFVLCAIFGMYGVRRYRMSPKRREVKNETEIQYIERVRFEMRREEREILLANLSNNDFREGFFHDLYFGTSENEEEEDDDDIDEQESEEISSTSSEEELMMEMVEMNDEVFHLEDIEVDIGDV